MEKYYIRSERTSLFDPGMQINIIFDILGNPTDDELSEAIKSAFEANETTMSKVVIDGEGNAYYERLKESANGIYFTDKSPEELIIEQEQIPFRLDKGELMRVFVVRQGEKLSLHIIAHHMVGDGKSIVYFTECLMRALSGEKLEFRPFVGLGENEIPKDCKLSPMLKLYVSHINKKWAKEGMAFGFDDYYAVFNHYKKEHKSRVLIERFSAEELSALHAKAKAAGISMNTLISCAMLKAEPNAKTVGLAVNGRLDNNRSMSNQASGVSVDLSYDPKKSLSETGSAFQKRLMRKLNDVSRKYFVLRFISSIIPSFIDSVLMQINGLYDNRHSRIAAKLFGYGAKPHEVSLTNLTRLDIPEKYGKYEIKSFTFIPPTVSYANSVFGAATIGDELILTNHSNVNSAEAEALFKRTVDCLRTI